MPGWNVLEVCQVIRIGYVEELSQAYAHMHLNK